MLKPISVGPIFVGIFLYFSYKLHQYYLWVPLSGPNQVLPPVRAWRGTGLA